MNSLTNIKKAKLFDFVGQMLCLFLPLITALITMEYSALFFAYFMVGGWQVVSCIAALIKGRTEYHSSSRALYNILLLTVTVAFILSMFFKDVVMLVLFGLLFFSPFMAVFYMVITYIEYDSIVKLLKETDHE